MSVAPSNPKGMHMSTKIKHAITTPDAPQPAGPYSQGIVSGDLLFTAGFGPQDPATGAVAESVGEQTRQVLRNLQARSEERRVGKESRERWEARNNKEEEEVRTHIYRGRTQSGGQ